MIVPKHTGILCNFVNDTNLVYLKYRLPFVRNQINVFQSD